MIVLGHRRFPEVPRCRPCRSHNGLQSWQHPREAGFVLASRDRSYQAPCIDDPSISSPRPSSSVESVLVSVASTIWRLLHARQGLPS